jgi:hypothetical protein
MDEPPDPTVRAPVLDPTDPSWSKVPVVILSARTLVPEEFARLSKACAAILTKGRGDTQRVVDAILRAVLPRRRLLAEAVP